VIVPVPLSLHRVSVPSKVAWSQSSSALLKSRMLAGHSTSSFLANRADAGEFLDNDPVEVRSLLL